MEDLRDRWALVTGASSGLGADYARDFAARGCKLVLVARREERLAQLAAELASAHRTETRVVALDLTREEAPDELHDLLRAEGVDVHVLVNNAGAGVFGPFLDTDWTRQRQMLAARRRRARAPHAPLREGHGRARRRLHPPGRPRSGPSRRRRPTRPTPRRRATCSRSAKRWRAS